MSFCTSSAIATTWFLKKSFFSPEKSATDIWKKTFRLNSFIAQVAPHSVLFQMEYLDKTRNLRSHSNRTVVMACLNGGISTFGMDWISGETSSVCFSYSTFIGLTVFGYSLPFVTTHNRDCWRIDYFNGMGPWANKSKRVIAKIAFKYRWHRQSFTHHEDRRPVNRPTWTHNLRQTTICNG